MSDTVVKVIPADPRHVPPPEVRRAALECLIQLAPEGEEPGVRVHRKVQYIDAGEHEEGGRCPRCGHRLSFDWEPEHAQEMDWYHRMMDETEDQVEGVQTVMPCCGAEIPYEEVQFENSAFARFELVISNPCIPYPLSPEAMQQLEAILGCSLKQVWARY